MEHKDNKLKINLDFLEEDASEVKPDKPVYQKESKEINSEPHKPSKLMSDGVKKWLTGIAIVISIGLFGALSDDSSPTPSAGNSTLSSSQHDDGMIQTGNYRCSQYHHNRAGELEPSVTEGASLGLKTDQLSSESDRMDSERYRLENEYVNEYDQRSIDQHNERIDDFNSRLQLYQYRARAHQVSIDDYNARVEAYNNYLIVNCTRAY